MKEMKKFLLLLLCFLVMFLLVGCSNEVDVSVSPSEKTEKPILDMTKLGTTMAYSGLINMFLEPDQYVGQTIRMNALFFNFATTAEEQPEMMATLIDDTGCCEIGIEFFLKDEIPFDALPELMQPIVVEAVFSYKVVDGNAVCYLADATIETLD